MHANEQRPMLATLSQSAPVLEDDEIDLLELLDILLDGKWLIAAITALCLVVGGGYAFFSTPIYQAEALLQVKERSPKPLAPSDKKGLVETEIQTLRSRSVVGQAVDRLDLTVSTAPKRFPLIGGFIARRYRGDGPSAPWFGLDSYAWGGERVGVSRFIVPESLQGKEFTLIAGEAGQYRILDPDGTEILSGKVGEEAVSTDGRYRAFVAELVARPETEFVLVSRARPAVIENLLKNLDFRERGKGTGIIGASLKDPDPHRAETILQAITDIYLRQDVERRFAQAGESLHFLLRFIEEQLPQLRQQLDAAEEQMRASRQQHRAVDLGAQARSVLKQMADVESQLAQVELTRAALSKRFEADHPRVRGLDERRAELWAIKARLDNQIESMPETQQEVLRLSHQVEVNTALYTALLTMSEELPAIEAGTVGNVRILEPAVAGTKAVEPKKALAVAFSLLLGLVGGTAVVFGRHALRRAIRSPVEVETRLGLPVCATIPFAPMQRQQKTKGSGGGARTPVLAAEFPQDPAVESLRSFRTSIHFAMLGAKGNRVVITGPAPDVGKSFLAVNTAYLLGESGKRVLLIDADMRRGHLHDYTDGGRAPGLSEVLIGQVEWRTAIRPLSDHCDMLPAGTIPPNPSELLMSGALDTLLEQVSALYDYVVIGAPPVLAVTDADLIAAKSDATILVTRAGKTELSEIEFAVKRLKQTRANVSGVAVNAVSREARRGRGAYRYYQYEYRSDRSRESARQ